MNDFGSCKQAIKLGDTTTHGGRVITASSKLYYNNVQAARMGDKVYCPKCGGEHVIVEGSGVVMNGSPLAMDGDLTSCGARLVASSVTNVWIGPGADPARLEATGFVDPMDLQKQHRGQSGEEKAKAQRALERRLNYCQWEFLPPGKGESLKRVRFSIVNHDSKAVYSTGEVKTYEKSHYATKLAPAVGYDLSKMPKKNRKLFDALVKETEEEAEKLREEGDGERQALIKAVHFAVQKRMSYAKDNVLYPDKPKVGKGKRAEVEHWANVNEMIDQRGKAVSLDGVEKYAAGDCEDFCIMKYVILHKLGYPENNMRLLLGDIPRVFHAILLVYDDISGNWYRLNDSNPGNVLVGCADFIGKAQYLVSKCNDTVLTYDPL